MPHPSQRPSNPDTGTHHAPGAAAVGGARQRWEHGASGSTGPNCTKGTAGGEANRSERALPLQANQPWASFAANTVSQRAHIPNDQV